MGAISEIYGKQFADDITIGVQQLMSKFKDRVLIKNGVAGESTTFDIIGDDEARTKTARHQEAIIDDADMSRVTCYLDYKYKARQIDPDDGLKTLSNPQNANVRVSLASLNRAIDDAIITSINGTKYTGKKGTTSNALPSSQQIVSGSAGLNITKLIDSLELFNDADVDENIQKFFAIGPKQLSDLLAIDKVTSADYASLKALVPGKVVQFMGFNFVLSTRLNTNSSSERLCLAWAQDGVGLAVGKDITAEVRQGTIKEHLSWQSYVSAYVGATRIEDEKVVEIACKE